MSFNREGLSDGIDATEDHPAIYRDGARLVAGKSHTPYIDIVFDGPPGPESGRFVEVEDMNGRGIRVGEWIARHHGFYALRLPAPSSQVPTSAIHGAVHIPSRFYSRGGTTAGYSGGTDYGRMEHDCLNHVSQAVQAMAGADHDKRLAQLHIDGARRMLGLIEQLLSYFPDEDKE